MIFGDPPTGCPGTVGHAAGGVATGITSDAGRARTVAGHPTAPTRGAGWSEACLSTAERETAATRPYSSIRARASSRATNPPPTDQPAPVPRTPPPPPTLTPPCPPTAP